MPESLSSLRKAAILLVSVDTQSAVKLMGKLDPDSAERVANEISKIENISADEREAVLEEYYKLGMASTFIDRGGASYAFELLEKSFGSDEAKSIIDRVKLSIQSTPFGFLKKTPPEALVTFLADEYPQTIALVLAHLLPKQASQLLGSLPPNKQVEVTKRIAKMEQTSPEVVREVERALEARLSSMLNEDLEQVGGPSAVAEILNTLERSAEKQIMEALEPEDPELVEEVRKLMFVFEDIALVDQRGIQEVLKEVQNDSLALALKGANDELKTKFLGAMSERAAALVKENMEFLGPVRLSDVERAQQEIVDVVRRLGDAGTITIRQRGGGEAYIE